MSLSINDIASRPVNTASAVKISLLTLGVIASLAVGKALLAQGLTTPAMAEPVAVAKAAPVVQSAPKKEVCRRMMVELDNGEGVGGRSITVCRKAL